MQRRKIGRRQIRARVSASERTALAACSETNLVQSSSDVLEKWECSSVPQILAATPTTTPTPSRHATFARAGIC